MSALDGDRVSPARAADKPVGGYPASAQVATRRQTWLWLAQRASAAVLALCVAVHLATMIGAVRGGLTAAEILARTRGSLAWMAFYGVFVLAVAIHAPIGVRTIVGELAGRGSRALDLATVAFALVLAAAGLRAVFAVTVG
jgi:succinate dehydrogenase subunit C